MRTWLFKPRQLAGFGWLAGGVVVAGVLGACELPVPVGVVLGGCLGLYVGPKIFRSGAC